MTKLWKISMLVLLLAIPAMAYIFLQLFGENRYDVPIYYEDGVKNAFGDCDFPESQHYIPLQALQATNTSDISQHFMKGHVTVFSFLPSICGDTCQLKFNQLSRIVNFFSDEREMKVLSIVYTTDTDDHASPLFDGLQFANWVFVNGSGEELENFVTCGLVMPFNEHSLHQFVLADKKKRIRGYYSGWDGIDVDRLITELRILLSNYKRQAYGQNNS
jgi:protein SCO1